MNEGKMFGNQGSPEQVKKAEESMSLKQGDLSFMRENALARFEKIDKGVIDQILELNESELSKHGYDETNTLQGKLNEHDIKIDVTVESGHRLVINGVFIDGERVPSEIEDEMGRRIYGAYRGLSSLEKASNDPERYKENFPAASETEIAAYELLAKL